MVGATFQLRRGGNQNNNWYANASIGGGGALQNVKGVSTNSHSSWISQQIIAFDAAANTSNRTYSINVSYSASSQSSANVQIRHASIWANEIKP